MDGIQPSSNGSDCGDRASRAERPAVDASGECSGPDTWREKMDRGRVGVDDATC
jgi:hypothetical protein